MRRSATSPLRDLRVMVAEDELLISQFIREILLQLACTVVGPVSTLDEALRAIRSHDIDGALLDVQLGDTSIDPAVNELALRRIPFILMTGQRNLGGFPSLLRNAPLLAKPFKIQQLEDLMSSSFRPPDLTGPRDP
jgi:DNA-binding response OmpR family regulator